VNHVSFSLVYAIIIGFLIRLYMLLQTMVVIPIYCQDIIKLALHHIPQAPVLIT